MHTVEEKPKLILIKRIKGQIAAIELGSEQALASDELIEIARSCLK
jgi:hypothetical protein